MLRQNYSTVTLTKELFYCDTKERTIILWHYVKTELFYCDTNERTILLWHYVKTELF